MRVVTGLAVALLYMVMLAIISARWVLGGMRSVEARGDFIHGVPIPLWWWALLVGPPLLFFLWW